jgi:hypothetical protein
MIHLVRAMMTDAGGGIVCIVMKSTENMASITAEKHKNHICLPYRAFINGN